MSVLFDNAIASISLGVEDYARREGHRAQSAIRNFYFGVLLLAKELLAREAPGVAIEDILAERYRPEPDGKGGIKHVPVGTETVDFHTLGERFNHFSLPLDTKALDALNRIRNEIEHKFTTEMTDAVREAIARAFPVVAAMFRLLGMSPAEVLGETWQQMLETRPICVGGASPVHLFRGKSSSKIKQCLNAVFWPNSWGRIYSRAVWRS